MDDAADEDYDFDYEEDDDEDVDADIENMYYNAKAKRAESPDAAVADFERVVEKETQMGDWGFKALKQMTKLNFRRGRHADALDSYTRLLKYTKSAVTRNYSEKSINGILDYVSADTVGSAAQQQQTGPAVPHGSSETRKGSAAPRIDLATMERFYDVTKRALEESRNERLSVKTDLKLARLWLARNEFGRLGQVSCLYDCTCCPLADRAQSPANRFSKICAHTAPRPKAATIKAKAPSSSRFLLWKSRCMARRAITRSSKRPTTRRSRSRAPSHTRALWVSSANAAARCT